MWKRVLYFCSILGVFIIVLLYYGNKFVKLNNTNNSELVLLENNDDTDIIETSFEEEKIGLNTKISIKNIYEECNHNEEEDLKVSSEIINMKEDEAIEYFESKGYSLKEFNEDNILLENKISGICKNHFVIKFGNENDEFLSIYRIDENQELKLYKETDIAKEFLTTIDNDNFEKGIEVYGYENVEIVLEDFE